MAAAVSVDAEYQAGPVGAMFLCAVKAVVRYSIFQSVLLERAGKAAQYRRLAVDECRWLCGSMVLLMLISKETPLCQGYSCMVVAGCFLF
jgi:hypothetical protein